jgi:hypothetical protein
MTLALTGLVGGTKLEHTTTVHNYISVWCIVESTVYATVHRCDTRTDGGNYVQTLRTMSIFNTILKARTK